MSEAHDWQEYECAHGHRWWSAPTSSHCPVCETTSYKPLTALRDHVLGGVGPGTAAGRMSAVWDWIHEADAGREKVLEELCPGWSIISSKVTSEQALMVAFDALVVLVDRYRKALEYIGAFANDDSAMRTARTLHYDMAGVANEALTGLLQSHMPPPHGDATVALDIDVTGDDEFGV